MIAHLVMAHDRPDQLDRLVRAVHRDGRTTVVHVDLSAAGEVHQRAAVLAAELPGVHVLPARKCRWGGWSMVEVQLAALRELLRLDARWTHVVNVSGADFPLRPLSAIEHELAQLPPDVNLIDWARPAEVDWVNPWFPADHPDHRRMTSRVTYYYPELPGRRWKGHLPWPRRRLPRGVTWYVGSQWCVLSRAFATHLVHDPSARRLARFFRYTFIPDESFVQTAALNSRFAGTVVNDNRRLIEWEEKVRVWTLSDLDRLQASAAWYARKFDSLEVVDAVAAGWAGSP